MRCVRLQLEVVNRLERVAENREPCIGGCRDQREHKFSAVPHKSLCFVDDHVLEVRDVKLPGTECFCGEADPVLEPMCRLDPTDFDEDGRGEGIKGADARLRQSSSGE